jgi:Asp-tRNA(Asn)/Glu-tRNA(Gln) amidotransferase A subunit family amidase
VNGEASKPLAGLRIGVPCAWVATADPDVLPHFEAGLSALAAAGAALVRGLPLPELGLARAAHVATMGPEGVAGLGNELGCAAGRAPLNPDTRLTAALVRSALRADDFVCAARARSRAMAHMVRLFNGRGGDSGNSENGGNDGAPHAAGIHFLATPATACAVAPRRPAGPATFDQAALFDLVHFASLFNLTGHPALVVPVGFDADTGLPVGMQLVGPPWSEAGVLAVGAALEAGVAGRVAAGAAAAADAWPGRRVLFDPLAAATAVESVAL